MTTLVRRTFATLSICFGLIGAVVGFQGCSPEAETPKADQAAGGTPAPGAGAATTKPGAKAGKEPPKSIKNRPIQ